MPSIAEMARVTVGTTRAGDVPADQTAEAAWLIHTAAVEAAQRDPATTYTDDGHLVVVDNLKARARFLYPEIEWEDPIVSAEFLRPVYSYLRYRGAAQVLKRNIDGDRTKSLWLLSPTFDASGTARRRRYEPTARERALTAHEAGEDRIPSPVVVQTRPAPSTEGRWECCGLTFSKAAQFYGHGRMHGPSGGKRTVARTAPETTVATPVDTTSDGKSRYKNGTIRTGPGFDRLLPGQGRNSRKADDPTRPWGCTRCERTFPSAGGLGGHTKTHNAALPHSAAAKALVEVATPTTPVRKARRRRAIAAVPSTAQAVTVIATAPTDVSAALAVLANALAASDTTALSAQIDELRQRTEQIAAERDDYKARLEAVRSAFAA